MTTAIKAQAGERTLGSNLERSEIRKWDRGIDSGMGTPVPAPQAMGLPPSMLSSVKINVEISGNVNLSKREKVSKKT